MRRIAILLLLFFCTAHAEVSTKVGADGYFTVVDDIGWDYRLARNSCTDTEFELYMLTNAVSYIYKDYRAEAKSSKFKGLRIIFFQNKTMTDNQGNERNMMQSILKFEISKNSFAQINNTFGNDFGVDRITYSVRCTSVGLSEGLMTVNSLEKYLRVFSSNGGVISYNPDLWRVSIPSSRRF